MPNISVNIYTHSDPSRTQCRYYDNKGPHLNTLERFYIYAEYLNNNHLNDKHTILPNIIFNTLLKTPPAINTPLLPTPQSFQTKNPTQDPSQNE